MSKLGKKFTCWSCATKFYDLNKPNAKCPKCGSDPNDDPKKDLPPAAPASYGDDYGDDLDEEIEAPAAGDDEEDADDEGGADDAGGGDEDF